MRKSAHIRIGFMSAFALVVLQGCDRCSDDVLAHCVDQDGVVVDDVRCDADGGTLDGGGEADSGAEFDAGGTGGSSSNAAQRHHSVVIYRWWYGGHVPIGSPVQGGSFSHPVSVGGGAVARASTVRGGFGTPGGAHGVGAGE